MDTSDVPNPTDIDPKELPRTTTEYPYTRRLAVRSDCCTLHVEAEHLK